MRNFNYNLTFLGTIVTLALLSIIAILNSQPVYSQNNQTEVSHLDVNDTSSVSKFSVAAWFKTSNDYNSNAFIVNKAGDSGNMNYGIWMNSAEKIQAGFETSAGKPMYATSPLSYSDGNWHYAVVTYDGSAVNLYVDGMVVATKSASGSPDNGGDEPLRLGANSDSLNNYFIGDVDEVRVWSSPLSAQQVIDAYNGKFDTKNQIMYLDFSQPLNETLGVNQTSINATSALNQTIPNAASTINETTATNATELGKNQTMPLAIIKPQTKNETGTTNETGVTNETQIENQTSGSKLIEQNHMPKAFDQSVSVDQNGHIDITLVADDEDKDKLQFDITAEPSHGSLDNFNKDKGTMTYIPEKDYSGDDKISFRALDTNGGQSDPANVNIKINAAGQLNETQKTEAGTAKTENLVNETSSKQTENTNSAVENNIPPKADAGDDQKAKVSDEVKLDGGKSSDDDGKIVSYKWEQTDGPKVDLKKSDQKVASFTVSDSAAGSKLSFKLTVVDDKDASNSDDVTVEVEKVSQG